MENLNLLAQGFIDLATPQSLMWSLIGVVIGTLIGALPGLGPVAGIAILMPLGFTLETVPALTLLMGVYQGAMYGGRISAILINVPGEPSDVVTAFDGYPMTRQGRAGYALSLSAFASFSGGMIGFIGLVLLMPYLSRWGLRFGAPEMFALMLFALVSTSGLGKQNAWRGLISLGIGLASSVIGIDRISGEVRVSFGTVELWDGISFVAIAVGLFGLSEALTLLREKQSDETFPRIRLIDLVPGLRDLSRNIGAVLRGSALGYLIGVLPGAGATIATFMAYGIERRLSKTPERFGQGIDQGLSAPEAASNASIGGSLVPLFTLGIPSGAVTAVLLGALITVGLQPGPRMLQTSGPVIWATIASLFVANVLLLIINTAFIPFFTTMIRLSQRYLVTMIATLCVVGVYFANFQFFDVGMMLLFGVIGYLMRLCAFPLAPLILAAVLGPLLETNLRQSLLLSNNSAEIFFSRPIAATLLAATVFVLLLPVLRLAGRRLRSAFV
jgi:putative tricarboxylic transport membrane protein